jgi:beta-galactosidase
MKHAVLFATMTLAVIGTAAEPRQRIRFDDGWRFRVDPAAASPVAQSPFPWQWKPADVRSLDLTELPPDLPMGDWRAAGIGQNVFASGLRFAWYRATLPADAKGAAKSLLFEAVDDSAVVFLNGRRVLRHDGWNEPFEVPMRGGWNAAGPNEVVLLVENTGGGGGIIGSVRFEAPQLPRVDEAEPKYDDRAWRTVHLPHDYVVEGKFSPTEDGSHGFLPKPQAWYRKTFTLPRSWKGKKVWLEFDGVTRNATVFLNGKGMTRHASGYIGFRLDLTRAARYGETNTLAIHVDPRQNEGWWYEGGGLYRHVWLNATDPVHLVPGETYVRSDVRDGAATLKIRHALEKRDGRPRVTVLTDVLDPSGRSVAKARTPLILSAEQSGFGLEVTVPKPRLWSLETPNLYRLVTTVERNGRTIDRTETSFGIRTIRFDREKGFFLNGKHVLLKGTCNHQDHAGVGTAIPDRLQEWRIKKLKEMGSNAYRCSHNPPAPEVLEACDRLGMLVMDETRHLGDTTLSKSPAGTPATELTEFRELLRRDRNHPSVILWSVANEEPIIGTPDGARIVRAMKAAVQELDPTRPVTGALNFGWESGAGPLLDVMGFNYNVSAYDRIYKLYPNMPMHGSETASTVSTRGIYANDEARGYVSAYDVNHPGWGATAEEAWKAIANRPWMAGAFVWTGFDYKGEPTPYSWPCINSHFGILDIAGFPKDNFFYYQAWWSEKPVLHLLPHWNWPGREGQPIRVWVHGNAERVELTLNGRSLGTKEMPRLGHLEWDVPYEPGSLQARGFSGGREVSSTMVRTSMPAAEIRLRSDWKDVLADSEDAALVAVEVIDAFGNPVPIADNRIEFEVVGTGRVVGVGNGDPSDHDPDKATFRRAFNGKCMVLVGGTDRPGTLTLRATSPGLKPATMTLSVVRAR